MSDADVGGNARNTSWSGNGFDGGWKAGLDIGTAMTAYHENARAGGANPAGRGILMPTAVGYSGVEEEGTLEEHTAAVIGHRAFQDTVVTRLCHPLKGRSRQRLENLIGFMRVFREEVFVGRPGRPWGVVSKPTGADEQAVRELRAAANELLDRVVLVEECKLLSLGVFHEAHVQASILVDLGASGTRFFLQAGEAPIFGGQHVIEYGGDHVNRALTRGVERKYPDLLLSDATVAQIKHRLGFVAPHSRHCTLRLAFGQRARSLELTEVVESACDNLVRVAREGILRILAFCPSDMVEEFLDNIYLVGGGARLPGLAPRVEQELRRVGVDRASVHTLPACQSLVAIGALHWAYSLAEEQWGIPLFAYSHGSIG